MATKTLGRQGFSVKMRKEASRNAMQSNRKRDKERQRSSYRSAFSNAPGPAPFNWAACGFVIPPVKPEKAPQRPKVVGSWRHLYVNEEGARA